MSVPPMHDVLQGALRAREGDEDEAVARSAPATASSAAEEEPMAGVDSMQQQQSKEEKVPAAAPPVRGTCLTKLCVGSVRSCSGRFRLVCS